MSSSQPRNCVQTFLDPLWSQFSFCHVQKPTSLLAHVGGCCFTRARSNEGTRTAHFTPTTLFANGSRRHARRAHHSADELGRLHACLSAEKCLGDERALSLVARQSVAPRWVDRDEHLHVDVVGAKNHVTRRTKRKRRGSQQRRHVKQEMILFPVAKSRADIRICIVSKYTRWCSCHLRKVLPQVVTRVLGCPRR